MKESLKIEIKSGSESKNNLDSKLNSKSYVKSNKRSKRIQPNRKVKIENVHLKEVKVLFIFSIIKLHIKSN